MASATSRKLRAAVAAAFAVALISSLTAALGYSSLGLVGVDMNARFNDGSTGDVILVVITEEDDSVYFGSRRPFDAETLDAIIRRAITVGGAAAIGLDLSTPSSFYRDSAGPLEQSARLPDVVWSHWWECEGEPLPAAPSCDPDERVRKSALGGMDSISSGLAQFVVDRDLRVRKFRRAFESARADSVPHPSFATAVVRAAGIDVPTDDTHDRWISQLPSTGIFTLTLGEFMRLDSAALARGDGSLRGKIVLVGGGAGQDVWATSTGFRSGLALWAQIVATELSAARAGADPERVPGTRWSLLIDIVVGWVAVLIAHQWLARSLVRPERAHGPLLGVLGLVLLLALSLATILLSPLVTVAFFAPMFGVGILSRTISRALYRWGDGPEAVAAGAPVPDA